MKKIQLLFVALFGMIAVVVAQQKVNDKAVIKTPGAQCEPCKMRIENYVSKEYGVLSVNVDIRKKTTTVTWITDRTNIENIKAAIATVGFDADDVSAEESAYKRLPECCKKPVEKTPAAP
ncbi:MAG: heavy-metal-associated domain-containing protein [Bacteroidetes bacterium]|nr:heavy-metal-associated domain-containing protein [Bacteroidota bacterium]